MILGLKISLDLKVTCTICSKPENFEAPLNFSRDTKKIKSHVLRFSALSNKNVKNVLKNAFGQRVGPGSTIYSFCFLIFVFWFGITVGRVLTDFYHPESSFIQSKQSWH